MMGNGYGNIMGGGMLMMWPWMFLLTALVIAGLVFLILLIVRLVRRVPVQTRESAQTLGPDNQFARRILDERYARGEIGHDEYRQRRETLA
ncbi:MAG: SHOCT domain-containing protein [Microbacteriaceae bacterium]